MKHTVEKSIRYCFIINPFAGKGRHVDTLRNTIPDICRYANVEFDICVTEKVGDVKEYIKNTVYQKKENEAVGFFACGGDGTLCETVNAVMSLENRDGVFVGIIPIGTGNDFVRNFGSEENFMNIESQIASEPYWVDLIKCNDMYSVNMINIGFDCEVVSSTLSFKRKKYIPSKFAYIAGLVVTLIRKPGVKMRMSVDKGNEESADFLLTTFASGEYCGGGFHSNPKASLNDGKIDSLFVKNISRTKFVSLVGSYKAGTHLENPKLENILENGKYSAVDMFFDRDINISVDGELIRAREAHLEIIKSGLGILLPKGVSTKDLQSAWDATEVEV